MTLLATCLFAAPAAFAACLTLASHPEDRRLWLLALPSENPTFALTYVHSVTRTTVLERYSVIGSELVETEIRFEQHGPGLPTEADAGGSFTRVDGKFVVTMDRHFPGIVMQVHAEQAPRLVAGTRVTDLAQWGDRALSLGVIPGPCAGP